MAQKKITFVLPLPAVFPFPSHEVWRHLTWQWKVFPWKLGPVFSQLLPAFVSLLPVSVRGNGLVFEIDSVKENLHIIHLILLVVFEILMKCSNKMKTTKIPQSKKNHRKRQNRYS